MIKLDYTRVSVVITCDLCPWWSAFAFTREEGWKTAGRHEEACHPGDNHARNAGRMGAAKSIDVTLDTPTATL